MIDLFVSAGELSGDLHGADLIRELLAQNPSLKIGAVAGPKMRQYPLRTIEQMESLSVMGFIDVLLAFPRLRKKFLFIRDAILKENPKAIVLIDYPGFHLRLAKSLRKKGFQGKIIHYICPSVWAWKKKRVFLMADTLDLLLTFFPFEKACFSSTSLRVEHVGHPLVQKIQKASYEEKYKGSILGIFPGSRKKEIQRNLPIQLQVAKKLQQMDPTLQIAISKTQFPIEAPGALIVEPKDHYELMRSSRVALATSGTVCLELALHKTPTLVTYAISKLDCFLAQKIFRIHLPYYALPNIVLEKELFPEFFGPNLTEDALFSLLSSFWFEETRRKQIQQECERLEEILGNQNAAKEAARQIHLISN